MHNKENCYENVWILSGTSDGPVLANKLLRLNYTVFASVVTYKASKSYDKNPKLHIITGKLSHEFEIISFIKKNKIKIVIDVTHPFAQIISSKLKKACNEIKVPLLFFHRESSIRESNNFKYISHLKDINKKCLKNKNILLAIGSRLLNDTANFYMNFGANVFTRVLPTHESISKAFGSSIKKSNIAILQPSKNGEIVFEKFLCEFWDIDYVLCRQSGSYSQRNWERIISGSDRKLFLVKKPKFKYGNYSFFSNYDTLIEYIARKY